VLHSTPAVIREILTQTHTWAVVGCSPDPGRASHRVAQMLQSRGYRVIPVNPEVDQLLGERCYPSVTSIPPGEGVEVVDVFRRADQAGAHVDEAIAIGASAVWLQLGVVDEAAAQRALDAGLDVVMDHCPSIELPRLG
jgi:predicted CoA-binding protein